MRSVFRVLALSSLAFASNQTALGDDGDGWVRFFQEAAAMQQQSKEPSTDWLKTCAGWSALLLCSSVFASGIPEEVARVEDLDLLLAAFADTRVNYDERSVTSACRINFENAPSLDYKAIWRQGIGCTLVERFTEAEIRAQRLGNVIPPPPLDPTVPWPHGEGPPVPPPTGMDPVCVARVVDGQFSNQLDNVRAMAIVFRQQLVFERYAPTVTKDSPLLGWSATKTLTGALMGIVMGEGGIDVNRPVTPQLVPEWFETPGDPRQAITPDMMMRFSSGTRWGGGLEDVIQTTQCLFYSNANCGRTSGQQPLIHPPNTHFEYNSGSTYLLSRMALQQRADRTLTDYEWPKHKLFWPIGAYSMYIEHAANGLPLGGALGYGTARDWARFGLLYQRDGVWITGQRVLPAGFVEYARTPSQTTSGYGAQVWLDRRYDGMKASGFRHQKVFIFPRQQLVIVRLATPPVINQFWNEDAFVDQIMACFTTKDDHNQTTKA